MMHGTLKDYNDNENYGQSESKPYHKCSHTSKMAKLIHAEYFISIDRPSLDMKNATIPKSQKPLKYQYFKILTYGKVEALLKK
jgi:hypothetical protein